RPPRRPGLAPGDGRPAAGAAALRAGLRAGLVGYGLADAPAASRPAPGTTARWPAGARPGRAQRRPLRRWRPAPRRVDPQLVGLRTRPATGLTRPLSAARRSGRASPRPRRGARPT